MAGMCGICCEMLNRPYKLQICGHSFCEQCLMFSITASLKDLTCFPLKCPHCRLELSIYDISLLMSLTKWQKLIEVALNEYVTKNG